MLLLRTIKQQTITSCSNLVSVLLPTFQGIRFYQQKSVSKNSLFELPKTVAVVPKSVHSTINLSHGVSKTVQT